MLYGNPDEDIDIVVEGNHWDICFVLDLSERTMIFLFLACTSSNGSPVLILSVFPIRFRRRRWKP